jgi:outer membrane receptor for monomeric catechols
LYFSANYTWVDSQITLSEAARRVQTSSQRPLAGQSSNLFNLVGEVRAGGFIGRVLYNFNDERIADVGANGAPDVLEQGRGTVDAALSYKIRQFNVKLGLDNLTDAEYRWTQGPEDQRRFKVGRTMSLSFGYSFF